MGTLSTKLQKHSERKHALLSASGAGRWMNCTPSAMLEELYGEKKSSVYADEGTLAHELAQLYLSHDLLENIDDVTLDNGLEHIYNNELFKEEMLDYVPVYTNYCTDQYNAAKAQNNLTVIEVEQKLDLAMYIPESFGTADCIIINDGLMEVIDLKYGKGVPVAADWNKQLMLYGLGALHIFDTMYDIEEVRLTIVQPRLDNISSWQISAGDLLSWAEEELRPKAKMAFAGEGELSCGDWCRFCSVRNRCRKLYEEQTEIARHEFVEPDLLTDEEIADIVKRTPGLISWANSIYEYATKLALEEGKQWPGLKVVEGRSIRKWKDEDTAVNILFEKCPELSEDDIYNMKLKSITDIEKIVGKKRFAELLSDAIIKPQGKPVLVDMKDKRPAMGLEQAKLDFSE